MLPIGTMYLERSSSRALLQITNAWSAIAKGRLSLLAESHCYGTELMKGTTMVLPCLV